MTLQELYDRLAFGELSQHQYGKGTAISDSDKPAIISHLNVALTNLHTQFPLLEREVVIQQYDHITEYHLNSKYSVTANDPTVVDKYIIDSAENPFTDDVVRVDFAYDEGGNPIPINDETNSDSIFNISWNTVQIPFPVGSNVTVLVYRAKHPFIDRAAEDTTEISMHPALEEAMAAFIASRCFISLGNVASAQLASYYMGMYNEAIAHVKRHNLLQTSSGESNIRLVLKGFI